MLGRVTDDRRRPVDPDIAPDADAGTDSRAGPGSDGRQQAAEPRATAFPPVRRGRWPRIHWGSVAAVAAGGFAGGLVRYLVGLAWPAPAGSVPWAIVTVNTAGAFVLALLVVLVLEVLPPSTYLRPAVGTGFCGALTTFSSVVTAVDQLAADGAPGVALAYLLVSVAAGVTAVMLGMVLGRAMARLGRERRAS